MDALKILLIDDDDFTNEIGLYMLRKEGISVEVRTSGADALHYLQECQRVSLFPDVMILDLYMPGVNGFHFIKHYENYFRKDSPNLKIYILTSSFSPAEAEEALSYESVKKFWNKPLTEEKIKELLHECK